MIDQAKGSKEQLLSEALHIQITPAEGHFNCSGGLELPGSWLMTLKAQGFGVHAEQFPNLIRCTQALKRTKALSQNISRVSEIEAGTKEPFLISINLLNLFHAVVGCNNEVPRWHAEVYCHHQTVK